MVCDEDRGGPPYAPSGRPQVQTASVFIHTQDLQCVCFGWPVGRLVGGISKKLYSDSALSSPLSLTLYPFISSVSLSLSQPILSFPVFLFSLVFPSPFSFLLFTLSVSSPSCLILLSNLKLPRFSA